MTDWPKEWDAVPLTARFTHTACGSPLIGIMPCLKCEPDYWTAENLRALAVLIEHYQKEAEA